MLRWFAVVWALLLIVSNYTQSADLRVQLVVNLVGLFFGASCLMIWKYRLNPVSVLALRLPRPAVWPAVVLGVPGGLIVATGLFTLTSFLLPVPEKMLQSFEESLLPKGVHAHNRALIAVSKAQEVGVDLELVRSNVEVVKLSERYFAPSKHAVITQATEAQRAMIFFRYWVVKEAVLKAEGIGLRGLSDCEVVLGQHEHNRDVQVRLGSRFTAPLHVCLLSCGEGWEAAVAAQDLNWVRQGNLEQW